MKAPVTAAEVTSSVTSGEVAAREAVTVCGIMMKNTASETTTQEIGLSKRLLVARL